MAAVGSIVGAGSLAAAAAPNVVHIGRLRAERDADDTARFMALFYQLEPTDQIMISDRLRSMVEIDARNKHHLTTTPPASVQAFGGRTPQTSESVAS